MAGLNTTTELRREIQALAAENEELKQMVQLLLENHDLRGTLQSQVSDAASLSPLYESTRIDGQAPVLGTFTPPTGFPLPLRFPPSSTPQSATPPMTPVGPVPVFQFPLAGGRLDSTPLSPHTPQMLSTPPLSPGVMGVAMPPQAPRAQRMQQFQSPQFLPPPVARLNLRSPPQNLLQLGSPGTPDSGMQGAGYISPGGLSQDSSLRSGGSSPGRLRGRGYCIECAVPFHPHIPDGSLADSVLSGRMNLSGSSAEGSSQDSSFG